MTPKEDLLERGKRVKERPRVTVTRFRDVPWEELNGCLGNSPVMKARWPQLRGNPVRIFAEPRPPSSFDIASGVAACNEPHFKCIDMCDAAEPWRGVVLCAHVLEID